MMINPDKAYEKSCEAGRMAAATGFIRFTPYSGAAARAWYNGYDSFENDKLEAELKIAQERKLGVFVFWPYDLFPYVLGAVGTMLENGDVYTPSYQGTVSRSQIIAIYPVELGKTINAKIEGLRNSMEQEFKDIKRKYATQLVDVMPEMSRHKSVAKLMAPD